MSLYYKILLVVMGIKAKIYQINFIRFDLTPDLFNSKIKKKCFWFLEHI